MKAIGDTQLAPETAKAVGKKLQVLLADFQVVYSNQGGFHRNVKVKTSKSFIISLFVY